MARGVGSAVALYGRTPAADALHELAAQGVRIRFVSRWLSAASVETDASGARRLLQRYGREAIRPVRAFRGDRPVREAPVPPSRRRRSLEPYDYGSSQDQISQIQVDRLHAQGFSGQGVRILVLDTGFLSDHEAFGQLRLSGEWDFLFGDPSTADSALDVSGQHNHGTGVLGVLAGFTPGELIGPAFRSDVLLAKTELIGSETRMEEDHFVAALEWGEALGADVATASLGYLSFPDEPDSFHYVLDDLDGDTAVTSRAMDAAAALGVVPICAVGNNGGGMSTLNTPADGDTVLAVGSVTSEGIVSSFSSRGPTADGRIKPDVMARGSLTTWARAAGGFAQVSGTSLATPLVAGAAALVLEAHPFWSPAQVIDALRNTGSHASTPDNEHGWGIVRAYDAVFALESPATPLPFELLEPPPEAEVIGAATFRWERASDLQTPDGLRYRIHFSSSVDFADTLAIFEAGADSFRYLAFLPEGLSWWRVQATDPEGNARFSQGRSLSAVGTTAAIPPDRADWASLGLPYPNPFNPTVSFEIRSLRRATVELRLFDVAGRAVRTLFGPRPLEPGRIRMLWDGRDGQGRAVASGSYVARARFEDPSGGVLVRTRRLLLLR